MNLKEGEYDNWQLTWHDNGQLESGVYYKNNIAIGVFTEMDENSKVTLIKYWDGKGDDKEKNVITVYDTSQQIDLRPQYVKEIAAFEVELAKWEKEHGDD